MAIAVILLWLASLSAYCTSKQQVLLERPTSKLLGWGLFLLFFFLAWLFLMGRYSSLAAFFLSFSYVMAAWIASVFVLGHFKLGAWQFGSAGALVSLVLFYLGAL